MRIIGVCTSIVIVSSLILWTVYDVHCVFLSSNATIFLHVHVNTCFCGIYMFYTKHICLEAIENLKEYNKALFGKCYRYETDMWIIDLCKIDVSYLDSLVRPF